MLLAALITYVASSTPVVFSIYDGETQIGRGYSQSVSRRVGEDSFDVSISVTFVRGTESDVIAVTDKLGRPVHTTWLGKDPNGNVVTRAEADFGATQIAVERQLPNSFTEHLTVKFAEKTDLRPIKLDKTWGTPGTKAKFVMLDPWQGRLVEQSVVSQGVIDDQIVTHSFSPTSKARSFYDSEGNFLRMEDASGVTTVRVKVSAEEAQSIGAKLNALLNES